MYSKIEIYKILIKTSQKYFKKHFINKDINTILYNISKEIIIDLVKILGRNQIKLICLNTIKNDDIIFEKFDNETKYRINCTILSIEEICSDIEKILCPIVEGLKE